MKNCFPWCRFCCFPNAMDQKMNDSAGFVVNRDDDNNKNNNGAFRRRARLSNISERDENNEDDGVFRKTCSNRHISLDTHSSVRRTRRRQRTIHKLLPVLLLVLLETQFSDSFSSRHDATARSRYKRVHPFNQFTKLRSAIMDEPTEKMYTSIQDVYLETYSDLDDQYSPDSREPLNSAYQYWELSLQSFNMDLYNLAHSDPAKAEDAVEVMLEMGLQNHNYPRPDSSSYTTVMDGYIRSGQLQEAQSVLDKMDVLAESDKTYSPTEFTYMLMAQAWANDWKDDFTGKSAEKAEAVLRRMQEKTITAETDEQSQISEGGMVKVWSIVVEAWCKRAGIARQAMQSASDLLNEMESYDTALVRPNVLTYTSYITGLSKCKDNHMARKAEATLERMTRHHVQPDMVAYTAVLNCWAKAVSRREREVAAVRALRLLGDMERLYIQKHVYSVKPSHITYATAIAAIGNSLDPEAPRLAEEILQRMDKLHKSDQIANLRPVTSTYNAVLYALSKAPSNSRQRYARRAEELLVEMNLRAEHGEKAVQPDVRTWAAVLRAWAHSRVPDAAENSQRVLDMMEDLYQRKLSPVHPNFVCFTTVMGAWGQSKRKGSLEKMEEILQRMEQGYEETLEADVRPNTISYVTCIDAFIRRSEEDAAERAQATVDRMMKLYGKGLGHVRPTRTVFNVLIHAWSRSKRPDSAKQAEKIFQWMESQYRAGDELVRPDEVSLCAVLNAWANQAENGGAERAQQIWEHTESISLEERGFQPTIAMPNIVIKAIARSKDPDAVSKAEAILLRLEKDYRSGKNFLRPDVTTYSSVINACAYCCGNAGKRAEALEIALRTFNKLNDIEDEKANNITYGTIFKAIQKLMPIGEDREELVRTLFDQCCEDGYVDHFVLTQVRYASPQLYRSLVEGPCGLVEPGASTSVESILQNVPTEWTGNVVQ